MDELESMAANNETSSNNEMLGADDDELMVTPDPPPQTTQPQQQANQGTAGQGRKPGPGLKRVRSFYTPYMQDKLCRELKFFFMGPHEKIKARGKCPWKLMIQILKIIVVTIQLIQFGYSRFSFVDFAEKTSISMEHLYLKDWSNSYETMPYPPAIGKYAIYKIDEVKDLINNAMKQYDKTEEIAIGSLRFYKNKNGTKRPMNLCLQQYKDGVIDDVNNTYNIDSTVDTTCLPVSKTKSGEYNITQYLVETYNMTKGLDFDRMLVIRLRFSLKSFRLDMNERNLPPQLYRVDVIIELDDSNKDGQMLVSLTTDLVEVVVRGHVSDEDEEEREKVFLVIFDIFVLLITVMSILLCIRSVIRAQKLRKKTVVFMKNKFGKDLSLADQFEFLNLWYVTIIINDVLTIVGTGYKIQLETRNLKSSSSNYDLAGIMLGTGSLLAWVGVLRYIGFFKQFNILIITLKKAFPNMARFLVCCLMLYVGFVICGWVVLGPYHIKFRMMSTASECLFSLINGDDMFVTFSATVTKSDLIWYYSRIYLYVFISLFIYAVLNLFIAVILDTYETIKDYWQHGFPKSELFEFIDQCEDPAHSPIYRREDRSCNPMSVFCCCCGGSNPDKPNEYTSLVN